MERTPRTPQEKKRLSLKKDRRNTYGENDKSSRKNIPLSKALSHRKVRHKAKDDLHKLATADEAKAETVESTLATARLQKGWWRKWPDTPLGEVVMRKLTRRKSSVGAKAKRRAGRLQYER